MLPFVTMGSGSLAAMAIFETKYRPDMEVSVRVEAILLIFCVQKEEAIELVSEAIQAGIFNDLGSGSNVDVVVIDGLNRSTEIRRGHVKPNEKPKRQNEYIVSPGTTGTQHAHKNIDAHVQTVIQIPHHPDDT